MKKRTATIAIIGSFLAGGVVGTAGAGDTEPTEPEIRTVTETVVETETVTSVPAACLNAVDALEFTTDWIQRFLNNNAKAWGAASEFDADALRHYTGIGSDLTDEIAAINSSGRYEGVIPGCRNA